MSARPDAGRPGTPRMAARAGRWPVVRLVVVAVTVGLAVALTVTVALTSAGSAHVTSSGRTFLQVNLCGNVCNRGGLAVVDALAASVRGRDAFAVTVDEVCENQYQRLRADLPGYQGRFDPTGEICRRGGRYGNVLLLHADTVSLVGSWALPRPAGDEVRRLMCLSPAPAGTRPLIVCVTHISTEAGNVGPQVARIAAILAGLDPAAAVVLGGDFNSDPADARLDPLYHPCYRGGTGRFQEADGPACAARGRLNVPAGSDVINEYTWNRHKLDDIFFSAGDWTAVTADAADVLGGRSDHIALAATATLLP